MRNRVNKLRKDKELAEWEIAEAKKKTKFAMKEIARKNREANEKLSLFQEKKEIEEELRKNCQREQEERKRNIKNFEERIIKQNKLYALRKKREGLEWDQLRNSNKLSDLEQKQAKCKSIDNSYAESLRQRCLSQRSQRSNFKDDYFNSIDSERKKTKKAYKTISKLEKLEEKLIEKLSKTLETRNIIIENLSKIKS